MIAPALAAYEGANLGAVGSVPSDLPAGYTDTAGDDALLVIFARPGNIDVAASTGWAGSPLVVQNTDGGFPVSGMLLRRPLDGSGVLPPDVVLSGTPSAAGVIVLRLVVSGAHPATPIDAGYPASSRSTSDAGTLGGGYSVTNPPALALQLWGGARGTTATSTYSNLLPGATHTLVGLVPGLAADGVFALAAQETMPSAGFTTRSVQVNEASSSVRFAVVYRAEPDPAPVTITGVAALMSIESPPGAVQAAAAVAGVPAIVDLSAPAGQPRADAWIEGAPPALLGLSAEAGRATGGTGVHTLDVSVAAPDLRVALEPVGDPAVSIDPN